MNERTERREPPIDIDHFDGVEMRVGRVISAEPNPKARVPAYVMRIDFGEAIGVKTTSAQITVNYAPEDLPGSLVVAVMNFTPKRIAGVKSEVLVLGAVDAESATVLVRPDREVRLGTRIL
ncbi:MAG: tRNA-binding protein [Planctomycetes bacterium]|nr:tRNA-binding protein [Planctomycetota bacterium]